jgi:hypothetical protein
LKQAELEENFELDDEPELLAWHGFHHHPDFASPR